MTTVTMSLSLRPSSWRRYAYAPQFVAFEVEGPMAIWLLHCAQALSPSHS